jgi:hypothetical protein
MITVPQVRSIKPLAKGLGVIYYSSNILDRPQFYFGEWKHTYYQRVFCDWFAKKNNIKSFDDWYKVKVHDITEHGGSALFHYYERSMYKVLSTVYPEYPRYYRKSRNI